MPNDIDTTITQKDFQECSTLREKVLKDAIVAVCGYREEDYGSPEDSFTAIAAFWTTYIVLKYGTRIHLDPQDIANMMILFKMGRVCGPHSTLDSYIDIAGYAACASECM